MIDLDKSNLDNKQLHISPLEWRLLQQFNLYRIVLSLSFLVGFYQVEWMGFLGNRDSDAFLATAFSLLISALAYYGLCQHRLFSFENQVILGNATDILLITLLSHYSGGLNSSLSILLIINVTATGTFLRGRVAILFAALAAIAILVEQTYSQISGFSAGLDYTRAGLLGLAFFATSYLASTLTRRVRETEQLADAREADIISLEMLNEDIIRNMRTGIIVVSDDGQIRMANDSAETLLGNIPLLLSPHLQEIKPALYTRFLEWQKQPNMHHNAIRQESGLPDIQPGFRRLQNSGDTLIFLEDATQLNQRFQQIKLASLGRLTASIAHEIRNPLSAINHAAQLLQEAELDAADKKLTDIITTQVQRLDTVVKNVLQLSRSNKSNSEVIELHQWLATFRDEFLLGNELKKDQLIIDLEDRPIHVLFDSSHLSQVMYNLCGNAIAHNNHPIEDVRIRIAAGHDTQHDQPYIKVFDNGPGIPDETIEQIFDPFFTTNSKGSGLGLFISREMVESNRAKIRYEEVDNAGSCFTIHLLAGTPLASEQTHDTD